MTNVKKLFCWALCLMMCCTLPVVAETASMAGAAVLKDDVHAAVEGYSGNDLAAGDVVALADVHGMLPMMREMAALPADCFTFQAFQPVDSAAPGELLYAFTSYFDADKDAARRENIELAAHRISGVTLLPGDAFSFNTLCAPYTRANGYKTAPDASASSAVNGVCQVSTTLYNAALGLGMNITHRKTHGPSGVIYVPKGLDCAVTEDTDFTFVNILSVPVTITMLTQRGALTALITVTEE